jgi:hypothetical protein
MSTGVEEGTLTAALQLGWRVAELYAHVNDPGEARNDTLLPASNSLAPADQLELQLRAAAGDARRAGIEAEAETLEELIAHAHEAASSDEAAEVFRGEVCDCHVELSKALWALDESSGKAYELGNGMSDTYSRIRRSYSGDGDGEEPASTWMDVFDTGRIERLKRLLDDLHTQLNPEGVAVVRHHLDVWRDEVPLRIGAEGPPTEQRVRKGLRRQTIIWRQLIAGDKQPEAYLDGAARAQLRGDLRKLVWSRCRRWVLPAALVLLAIIGLTPVVIDWYQGNGVLKALATGGVAIAGGLGLTSASVLVTVRTRIHQWSELLWERAVAGKVSDQTLVLDEVFPPPVREDRRFAALASSARDGVREKLTPRAPSDRPARVL